MDATTTNNDEEWLAFLTSEENTEWGNQSAELLEWSKERYLREVGAEGTTVTGRQTNFEHTTTETMFDDELNADIDRIMESLEREAKQNEKENKPRRRSWFGSIRKGAIRSQKGQEKSNATMYPGASPTMDPTSSADSSTMVDLLDGPDPLFPDMDIGQQEDSVHDDDGVDESAAADTMTVTSETRDQERREVLPSSWDWRWWNVDEGFNQTRGLVDWASTASLDAISEVGKYGTTTLSSIASMFGTGDPKANDSADSLRTTLK